MLASGTLSDVLGSFQGAIARTSAPTRHEWSWRRGRVFHEYWSSSDEVPVDDVDIKPDLEDVLVSLSLLRLQGAGGRP
jgi:hypothetical protein